MKGLYNLKTKIEKAGRDNIFISEVTVAELNFGVQNSQAKEKNAVALANFLTGVILIPIFPSLEAYAREKARLRQAGKPVDEFDLLIGATAIAMNITLISNNVGHLGRMQGITLEDWTK